MLKQNHTPNDTYSPLGDASPRLFTLSLEGSVVLTFRLRESQASLRLSVIFISDSANLFAIRTSSKSSRNSFTIRTSKIRPLKLALLTSSEE
jgi:hypothetical protein